MRIYLASRTKHIKYLREVRSQLQDAGHTVTSSWLNQQSIPDYVLDEDILHKYALQDKKDIEQSDMIISFSDANGRHGGRHCEFGMALASGIRCVVIGPREHIFHYLPNVEVYDDLGSLLLDNT